MVAIFSFKERLGMYFSVQAASLSAAAITALLCYISFRWIRAMSDRKYRLRLYDACDSSLFLTLMVAELIRAIGNIISVKWMMDGEIREGGLCNGQGIIKLIGTNAVSFAYAIAVQTFSVLVLRWRGPEYISKILALSVWVIVALIVGITTGSHGLGLYGDAGYWCWIILKYKTVQIMAEYLWMWSAGAIMTLLYGVMFFVMRGYIIIENGVHWHKKHKRVKLDLSGTENEAENEAKMVANMMLFYPAIYIVCVFPFSLSRWLFFSGRIVPYQFALFANALFAFSGLFNVILFYYTRPELVTGPSNPSPQTPASSRPRDFPTEDIHPESRKYGHLPLRQNPSQTKEDIEKVHRSASSEGQDKFQNDAYTRFVPSSPKLRIESRGHGGSEYIHLTVSGGGNHSRDSTNRSNNRFIEIDEDEDDYGRLPG